MSALTLGSLLDELRIAVTGRHPPPLLPLAGVALDTRELRPGDVFALRGASDHGYWHAARAIEAGAAAILAEAPLPRDATLPNAVPVLVASEPARGWRRSPSASSARPASRRSTRDRRHRHQRQDLHGPVHRPGRGTARAPPGHPGHPGRRTARPAGRGSAHHAGHLRHPALSPTCAAWGRHGGDGSLLARADAGPRRAGAVRCRGSGIFTQLSRDHLDYHGDMESYFQAKARPACLARPVDRRDQPRLSLGSPPRGDDASAGHQLQRIGEAAAGIAAEDLQLEQDGMRFTLRCDGERIPVQTRLIGRFNVENLRCLRRSRPSARPRPSWPPSCRNFSRCRGA